MRWSLPSVQLPVLTFDAVFVVGDANVFWVMHCVVVLPVYLVAVPQIEGVRICAT